MLSVRSSFIVSFGIVCLSLVSLPQGAGAEPIRVTTGSVSITRNIRDILSFDFSGNGLSVYGFDLHTASTPFLASCLNSPSLCQPGDRIRPEIIKPVSSEPGSGSSVTFQGRTVLVSWESNDSFLRFSGPEVVIPFATDKITLTMPFSMIANIEVHALDDPGPVIFSTIVLGYGTATLNLERPPGNPAGFAITGARYEFNDAPVPEPATIVLLTTGLAGIVVRKYRRARLPKQL